MIILFFSPYVDTTFVIPRMVSTLCGVANSMVIGMIQVLAIHIGSFL